MSGYQGVWRNPAEETRDYPGLVVQDGTVSGSIRCGGRLPLWAFIPSAVDSKSWEYVEDNWSPTKNYGWGEEETRAFLYNLLESRGEFGRLLCILADEERGESIGRDRMDMRSWWNKQRSRRRVLAQLRRCVEALEGCEEIPYADRACGWERLGPGVAGLRP